MSDNLNIPHKRDFCSGWRQRIGTEAIYRVHGNFFFLILVDTCPFVGPLIPLFWTSGDISSGFQGQSRGEFNELQSVYSITIHSFPLTKSNKMQTLRKEITFL